MIAGFITIAILTNYPKRIWQHTGASGLELLKEHANIIKILEAD
jgi:hypothetical protein